VTVSSNWTFQINDRVQCTLGTNFIEGTVTHVRGAIPSITVRPDGAVTGNVLMYPWVVNLASSARNDIEDKSSVTESKRDNLPVYGDRVRCVLDDNVVTGIVEGQMKCPDALQVRIDGSQFINALRLDEWSFAVIPPPDPAWSTVEKTVVLDPSDRAWQLHGGLWTSATGPGLRRNNLFFSELVNKVTGVKNLRVIFDPSAESVDAQ